MWECGHSNTVLFAMLEANSLRYPKSLSGKFCDACF